MRVNPAWFTVHALWPMTSLIDAGVGSKTQEAELRSARGAGHVIAATVTLDVDLAIWARLALPLNSGLTRRFFLFKVLRLHSLLILLARLALVPWPVTVSTSFSTALLAGADVGGWHKAIRLVDSSRCSPEWA